MCDLTALRDPVPATEFRTTLVPVEGYVAVARGFCEEANVKDPRLEEYRCKCPGLLDRRPLSFQDLMSPDHRIPLAFDPAASVPYAGGSVGPGASLALAFTAPVKCGNATKPMVVKRTWNGTVMEEWKFKCLANSTVGNLLVLPPKQWTPINYTKYPCGWINSTDHPCMTYSAVIPRDFVRRSSSPTIAEFGSRFPEGDLDTSFSTPGAERFDR